MTAVGDQDHVPAVVQNINAIVGAAFRAANDKRARSRQKALGMSELGSCRRLAAFKVSDIPKTNPRNERTDVYADSREAMVGTLIHDLVLPQIMEMSMTAEIEVPVVLQFDGLPPIPGSADMVDGDVLCDVKTLGHNSANWLYANGPNKKHIWQTHGYAQALTNSGHPIEHIALIYIDRGNGQVVHVYYQKFDPDVVIDIQQWWTEVNSAEHPMDLPRDERGPGLSRTCDWCEWLTACWGPDAVPGGKGIQANVLAEVPDAERAAEIERMLKLYHSANIEERRAKEDKNYAREVLSQVPSGEYGEMVLKWSSGSTTTTFDVEAAKKALTGAGIPLPTMSRVNAPRITVKPKSS